MRNNLIRQKVLEPRVGQRFEGDAKAHCIDAMLFEEVADELDKRLVFCGDQQVLRRPLGTGVGRHIRQPAPEFSQLRDRNPLGKEVGLTMGAAVAEFEFGDKGADQAPFRPEPFNHLLDNGPSSIVLAVDHDNDNRMRNPLNDIPEGKCLEKVLAALGVVRTSALR